ncbi:hypothetical protein ACIQAL_30930 [Pseudomonas sp. NPDC088368]|uniref:hypothetical protein n=1 Tax=Pseudomonas sp. NPDC088368 TaxID=3364453 RepID=UPI00382627DE
MTLAKSDYSESSADSDAKYQRALAHFHSDAQALKRGMFTALFVQRFKQGLIKPT